MSEKIIVFSEQDSLVFELIAGAKGLGSEVVSITIGSEAAQACIAHGADRVIVLSSQSDLPIEGYAEAVVEVLKVEQPGLFLVGMTNAGRTLAAMAAQGVHAPCVSECKSIERSARGGFDFTRLVYSGIATANIHCDAELCVATVPPRSYQSFEADETRVGDISEIAAARCGYGARVVDVQSKTGDAVDLAAANAIVCVGRGLAKQEDMAMIEDLADALGGVVACSRPVAKDYAWLDASRYIGLSRKTVKPKLLILVGVSGQLQMVAGAQESRVVLSVNNDESAPVFNASDYGIVADLYDVIPALTAVVKAL